jgi:hypothetical protein
LSVLTSTYSPHLLFQQQSISTNGLQCRWQPFPHFSEKPSERGGEKKEKRANASRCALAFRLAPRRLRPHRHRTATPQPTRGDTPNSKGSRDTHAHAHTHPSICILPRPLSSVCSRHRTCHTVFEASLLLSTPSPGTPSDGQRRAFSPCPCSWSCAPSGPVDGSHCPRR